ncbi:MAG: pilus assembly protein TadB [Nitrosomonadales bacterium]|nr:MAG: pilus assembly protein TadB [Nitrosomonadales bacterium]
MELYYVILVVAFIAGLLAVEALYGFWNATRGPEAVRVEKRLRLMSAGGHGEEGGSILKKRQLAKTAGMERFLLQMPRIHELDRLLVQAGSSLSVSMLMLLMAVLFAGVGVLAWLFSRQPLVGLALGAVAGMLPVFMVVRAKFKRMNRILLQLPDALDLLGRAMRAGHAFSGGVKMAAEEMPEPIAGEFRAVFDELNYGLPLENAMLNLAERVDIPDMKYFVISVLIQRETGGNLAGILDKISGLIRERLKLLGRVRVLASQGRLEAWILSLMPFVVAGILFIIWPDFMSILWKDPAGRVMVGTALVMMVMGIFVMWRMIRIRI